MRRASDVEGLSKHLQRLGAHGVVSILGAGSAEWLQENGADFVFLHKVAALAEVCDGIVIAEIDFCERAQCLRIE